jgi:hypothetical protein
LKQIDFNGNYKYHNLSVEVAVGVPEKISLSQNYPNPFNPTTRIDYEIPVTGKVMIKIYNMLGMEIMSLVNEVKEAGYYTVEFDGSNFASGVYFYRINTESEVQNNSKILKMVLIK